MLMPSKWSFLSLGETALIAVRVSHSKIFAFSWVSLVTSFRLKPESVLRLKTSSFCIFTNDCGNAA